MIIKAYQHEKPLILIWVKLTGLSYIVVSVVVLICGATGVLLFNTYVLFLNETCPESCRSYNQNMNNVFN